MLGDDPNVTMTARLVKLCMRKDGKMLTDAEFETVLDNITIEELAELLNDAMQSPRRRNPRVIRETETVLRVDARSTSTLPRKPGTSMIHASSTT